MCNTAFYLAIDLSKISCVEGYSVVARGESQAQLDGVHRGGVGYRQVCVGFLQDLFQPSAAWKPNKVALSQPDYEALY